MKLLRLPAYFEPEHAASSFLWQNLSEGFAKTGIEMVVYTPVPTRGISLEKRIIYKTRKTELMYNQQLVVHRFSLYSEGKNPVSRAVRYVLQGIIQFTKAIFAKDARSCNVMFITSTPPIQGAMAAMIKKCRHIPFVYNLQDIFPDSLVGTGMTHQGSLLWKIGRRIENFTYYNADKIIVISQDFKRNIMEKGVPEEKIEVIYNWVDENIVTPVKDEDNELFEEFGISRDNFRVVYAGNLGNAQNIEIIIDAAKKLKNHQQIKFVIFGKGGMEDKIKNIKDKEQLDNLMIFPLQPYERVSKVYGLGNVCIVACKPGLGSAAMPSKTWSIMSSGRAVLVNFDPGELKHIVEKSHCGVFTMAGDKKAFCEAILALSNNKALCEKYGRNGRQFILENLTREAGVQKYIEVIREVANKK